jgi:hypothetical protein
MLSVSDSLQSHDDFRFSDAINRNLDFTQLSAKQLLELDLLSSQLLMIFKRDGVAQNQQE